MNQDNTTTSQTKGQQYYSSRNQIPNIGEFISRLDREKAERDAKIEAIKKEQLQRQQQNPSGAQSTAASITADKKVFEKSQNPTWALLSGLTRNPNKEPPSSSESSEKEDEATNGEAREHKPEKRKKKGWRTVRDPVTGTDVQIQDIDMDYKKVVDNPQMSVPNESLGKSTTVPVTSSMSGEEYRHAQDITAPPDPIQPGSTSDVPIRSEKTSILFYKTPSVSYEPMFEHLEMRASFLAGGLFLGITFLATLFGGRIWWTVPLGAAVASAVFLWVKDLIQMGRENEWLSEKDRGEMATANLIPESAEWVNTMLGLLWGLINPEMFTGVADTIEDVMVASVPGIIENVRVADISQGSNPIRIISLRALPDNHMQDIKSELHKQNRKTMDPEELAAMENSGAFYNLEASVAYHARPSRSNISSKAKNMGMRLVFYLGAKGWFGMPFPVWVELIGLVVTVRMRVQLTPEVPFLKTLTFTFMGIPKVQAGCTPMVQKGINILNLPLISNFVNWAIKTAASMYVAPKSMTLDIASMLSGDNIVRNTEAIGIIYIRIHCGVNLSKQDRRGSHGGGSDPYVTVGWSKFSKPLFCTRVIQDYLNPVFEESCGLLVTPDTIRADEKLALELWDSDRSSADDVVGKIELSIDTLMENPNQMFEQKSKLTGLKVDSEMPGALIWDAGFFEKAPFREALRVAAEEDMEREKKHKEEQTKASEAQEQQQNSKQEHVSHGQPIKGHDHHDSKMSNGRDSWGSQQAEPHVEEPPVISHHSLGNEADLGASVPVSSATGPEPQEDQVHQGRESTDTKSKPAVPNAPVSTAITASSLTDPSCVPEVPFEPIPQAQSLSQNLPSKKNSSSSFRPDVRATCQPIKADRDAEMASAITKDEKHAVLIPPDPCWPSGILSIVVHQIVGLELANIKGSNGNRKGKEYEPGRPEAGHFKEEQGGGLPSSYCTILLNDDLVYRTRTKAISSQPIFNAGTEQFVRNWRSCIVTVTVRDSRNREHDPIIGLVPLPIANVLRNSSQVTRWYPLDAGLGFGRVRISLLFRSVQLQLPPAQLSWDVGTFEFTSKSIKAINYQSSHHLKLRLRTGGSSAIIGRDVCVVDKVTGSAEWDIGHYGKHSDAKLNGLRLPVRYRYRSPIFIEFWQPRSRHPEAFSSFWLQDIVDLENNDFDIPIWKCNNPTRLSQNYITESNIKIIKDLEVEEIGRLRFAGRFSTGTDMDHLRFVTNDIIRETIETWEACYANGSRTQEVAVEIPESSQRLHEAAEHEEKRLSIHSSRSDLTKKVIPEEEEEGEENVYQDHENGRLIVKDGMDWSREFREDPAYMAAGDHGQSVSSDGGIASVSSHSNSEAYTTSSIIGTGQSLKDRKSWMTTRSQNPSVRPNTAHSASASLIPSELPAAGSSSGVAGSSVPTNYSTINASFKAGPPPSWGLTSPNQGHKAVDLENGSETKNLIKMYKSYKERSRDLHRMQRGMMQWKPVRNIRFAKNESAYAVRRIKNMGSSTGRTPDVETEISNNK